jgi:hypothetical protein
MFRFAGPFSHGTITRGMRSPTMRWCISLGAAIVGGVLAGSAIAGTAAPSQRPEVADKQAAPSVDVELVIAVDVSYSMDLDELAVQREGYAQAIVSKEFLGRGPRFPGPFSSRCRCSIKTRSAVQRAIRTKLLLEVAGRTPEHRIVPVAEKEPRVSCTIGEKIWQDRWGR